jgi:molybdopterin converting factor subunit 1
MRDDGAHTHLAPAFGHPSQRRGEAITRSLVPDLRYRSVGRMITVRVRLFAGLHQLIGEREIEMRLPDGATIAVLRDTLGAQHPVVEALLPTLVCAIDEEYVESSQLLRDGDRVALIPPVSGGSGLTPASPRPSAPPLHDVERGSHGEWTLIFRRDTMVTVEHAGQAEDR